MRSIICFQKKGNISLVTGDEKHNGKITGLFEAQKGYTRNGDRTLKNTYMCLTLFSV
jgi:hypothetical protein